MIYYTGDIHGSKLEIVTFCMRFQPTKNDTIIILGDVGANYFGNERDAQFKAEFAKLEPTIFCIHGNHEFALGISLHIKQKSGTAASYGMRKNIQTFYLQKTARFTILKEQSILLSAVHTAWINFTV